MSNRSRVKSVAAYHLVTLRNDGDRFERETWPELEHYLKQYEAVWRMHVVPLRSPGSIYLRHGIDEQLEIFAMNHYTAYVNAARAFEKIKAESNLHFAEEIWSNLQRAIEVARKEAAAFAAIYQECFGKPGKLNTAKLEKTEASLSQYRNRLHDAMPGTLRDDSGFLLIPKRNTENLGKYSRWTGVMYGADSSDFVAVKTQLLEDFALTCSTLQDLWTQIEKTSVDLISNQKYLAKSSKIALGASQCSTSSPLSVSGSMSFRPQS